METQIRIADRTGQLRGDVNPVQERAVRLLIEIEMREREEERVLTMRTNRVLSNLAGIDFEAAFLGTGTSLPTSEAPVAITVTTEDEIDQIIHDAGPARYVGAEEEITPEDFMALLRDVQTQKFTASDVSEWSEPL